MNDKNSVAAGTKPSQSIEKGEDERYLPSSSVIIESRSKIGAVNTSVEGWKARAPEGSSKKHCGSEKKMGMYGACSQGHTVSVPREITILPPCLRPTQVPRIEGHSSRTRHRFGFLGDRLGVTK
jgi:hypothetical protein